MFVSLVQGVRKGRRLVPRRGSAVGSITSGRNGGRQKGMESRKLLCVVALPSSRDKRFGHISVLLFLCITSFVAVVGVDEDVLGGSVGDKQYG